jgi:hypothetical protein
VNLAQIRTFVEMDSHEGKLYMQMRQNQEREAKQKMREKAKELQKQRMEAAKKGIQPNMRSSTGFGRSNGYDSVSSESYTPNVDSSAAVEPAPVRPSYTQQ